MIRIVKKNGHPAPVILLTKGVDEKNNLILEAEKGNTNFKFKNTIYGHPDVKKLLAALQHGKCCFCETKIKPVAHGDIEHFRPKGGWVQNGEKVNTVGYYWLAYEWDNLLLSCEICNQTHKKNYFPLLDPSKRAKFHTGDIRDEEPVLINPVFENPELFIEFSIDRPQAVENNFRGKKTIELLGLDRKDLEERRKKVLNYMILIYDFVHSNLNLETNEEAKQFLRDQFIDANEGTIEYASMLRCFFKKNPIDF